jgi:dCMP deaminase
MDILNYTNLNHKIGIPSLEYYYMIVAHVVSFRANCLNRPVGSVLVTPDNGSIIATGYNGVPKKIEHCKTCRRRDEGFKSGEGLHRCRAEHAERSVINQAAKYGRKTEGAILYVTDLPCSDCCKGIINNEISKVYYCVDYPGSEAHEVLKAAGIEVQQLSKIKVMSKLKSFSDEMVKNIDTKMPIKFYEDYEKGNVTIEDIDDYIELWHKSDSKLELNEFLGLTDKQYNDFVFNNKID